MKKSLSKLFGRLRKFLSPLSRSRHDFQPREDDIFLVSYPRSGNTWLRFLLANAFSHKKDVDFYSVHQIIPDLQIKEQYSNIRQMESPRLLKTHQTFISHYRRVIYLVRDARDVYVSYYHYLQKKGESADHFTHFLQLEFPYGYWHEHVRSWLFSKKEIDLLMVRYEDMLHDTQYELERIMKFVGLPYAEEQIEASIQRSSFDSMQQLETKKGRPYGSAKQSFVRKGQSGQWPQYFDESGKRIIKDRANDLLMKLNYVEDVSW